MKNHMIVKLKERTQTIEIPCWIDHIQKAVASADSIHPEIDGLLSKLNLPVKVTREFPHKERSTWSQDEIDSGLDRIYRLILKRDTNFPENLIQSISLIPGVEYARAGSIAYDDLPVTESIASGRAPYSFPQKMIRLPEAHAYTKGDSSIKVAVLDTGVDLDHRELSHALIEGFDFVDIIDGAQRFIGDFLGCDPDPSDIVGHGTHVAGLIAAKGVKMPEGVVPECQILPVRVLGAMKSGSRRVGAGLVDNINTAVKWAVDKGADVINMSLGIRHVKGTGLPHEEVVNYAKSKGITVVAASGNDGTEQVYYPSGHSYVITVGAADDSGHVAQFSTYGFHVDFIAPGTNIYSASLNNGYAFSSGTSHATPFLSGAVASLKALGLKKGKKLQDRQAKHILKFSSDKTGTRFKDRMSGYGMLNLRDAMRLCESLLH